LTAFQVHQQLKEKARQRFMTIGSMFPSGKLDGRVMKTELKAILNQLTLPIEDDEFEKLWLRYDTEGRGVIQVEKLMSKLGIELKEEISGVCDWNLMCIVDMHVQQQFCVDET
jgi:Ca2+-binding EF-hand superfamily protein